MWDLPGPGLEPLSPALAGGLLTTAPPGKPHTSSFFFFFCKDRHSPTLSGKGFFVCFYCLFGFNKCFFFLNFGFIYLLFIYLFIYLWLCWVFVSVLGLSLVAASGGHSSLRFAGLSLSRPLLLQSTGSRRAGSVIVAHGLSCSAACGIFPDQRSNPCPLHWQADSQPLRHQGSPIIF